MRVLTLVPCLLLLEAATLVIQGSQASKEPAFEVASVKQNIGGGERSSYEASTGGTVVITNMTLRMIVGEAYGIAASIGQTLLGGPDQILLSRFDIVAKTSPGTTRDQQRAMLKSLLAERFQLRTHAETRQVPIFALTVARTGRLGPKLRPSNHNCQAFLVARGRGADVPEPRDASDRPMCTNMNTYDWSEPGVLGIRHAGNLAELIRFVQGFVDRERRIVDMTGLTGNFEWEIRFLRSNVTPPANATAPSVFTAFHEQLGLKLEPRNSPLDVVVIDAVEMPTPN